MTDDGASKSAAGALDEAMRAAALRDGEPDPRWEQLAAGELTGEDRDAFEREASATADGRALWAALAPAPGRQLSTDDALAAMGTSPGTPAPVFRIGRRRALATSAALAAAAAAVLVLRPTPLEAPRLAISYDVALTGHVRSHRGLSDPAAPRAVLPSDGDLDLTLTPRTPPGERVVALTFIEQGGQVSPWPAPVTTTADGRVSIAGPVSALFAGRHGDLTLLIVAGRPGALPADAADVARGLAAPTPPAWDVTRVPVRLGEAPASGQLDLEVQTHGCAATTAGPVCELDRGRSDDALTLWVRADPAATLELSADGVPIEPAGAPTPVEGGRRLTVAPPVDASALTLAARLHGASATWTLALRRHEPPAALLAARRALYGEGDLAVALAELEASRDVLPRAWAGEALGLAARHARREGRLTEALELYRRSVDLSL